MIHDDSKMHCFGPGEAPPDAICHLCEEPITQADSGFNVPFIGTPEDPERLNYHHDCFIRSVVGSVGHLLKLCHCHGGQLEDLPELTARQNATVAVALWNYQMMLKRRALIKT